MKLSLLLVESLSALSQAHTHISTSALQTNSALEANVASFSFDELYQITDHFFDQFLYPNNVKQAKSINSTLFAKGVLGRVDATRTFVSRELNTEYLFGLFANIAAGGSFSLLGVPISYNIVAFTGNANVISCRGIVEFNQTSLGVVSPIEIELWMTVNAKKRITQFDATFRLLQWNFDYLLGLAQHKLGLNSTAETQAAVAQLLANSICGIAQTYCKGTNVQYNSTDQCLDFLLNEIPFGQSYQMGMNTLLCRMVHQSMVPSRPDVHCPHIGPSGGGYCDNDIEYSSTILEPFFTKSPFVPYGYQNKNKTIAEE